MDIRETVHDLIKKNRIETAITTLLDFLKDKDQDLYREAVDLTRRHSELATNKRRGLIDDEKAGLESRSISNALYDLADYASGKKLKIAEDELKGAKGDVNVDNAGIVGDDVKLSGEYVAGGNITINYYNKPEEEKKEKTESSLSDAELEGLKFSEEILIEKLNDFRKAYAISADGPKKFELKKSIQQAEAELAEVQKKMGK